MTLLRERLPIKEKPPKLCARSVEFRASDTVGDGRTLEGYAAVFDSPTMIESFFGDFEEEIASGAFRKTLREKTPVLQFDHGRDFRTGTLPIGEIRDLREDEQGLFVGARLFRNDVVEPIREAIEAGAISGMSFRFRIMDEIWRDADGTKVSPERDEVFFDILMEGANHERGPLRRTIREVELFELGPVVFPAYDATSVGVRSMLELAQLSADQRRDVLNDLAKSLGIVVRPDDDTEPEGRDTASETPDDPSDSAGDSKSNEAEPAVSHSALPSRTDADWFLSD